MHRSRTARLAVAALGLSIVTSMLAVIPALAADTRNIEIGSLDSDNEITIGQLSSTTVSTGESFIVTVRVLNNGPQNINNVYLELGLDNDDNVEAQPQTLVTPTFPAAFDDGTTVTDILAGDDKCGPDEDPENLQPILGPITCDIGTLRKGKFFTLTALFTSATDSDDLPLKATVKVSENANDSGANTDTFAAEGSVDVLARTCSGLYGYLPAGQAKNLTTVGETGDCAERITLDLEKGTTNQNAVIFAEVEATDDGSDFCGTGTTCFGNAFEISVNNNQEVDGYFDVTLFWADLPDGFNITKAGVVHDGSVIPATKKFECSTKKLVDCWTQSDVVGDTWTFTIRLDENGFIRGKG